MWQIAFFQAFHCPIPIWVLGVCRKTKRLPINPWPPVDKEKSSAFTLILSEWSYRFYSVILHGKKPFFHFHFFFLVGCSLVKRSWKSGFCVCPSFTSLHLNIRRNPRPPIINMPITQLLPAYTKHVVKHFFKSPSGHVRFLQRKKRILEAYVLASTALL